MRRAGSLTAISGAAARVTAFFALAWAMSWVIDSSLDSLRSGPATFDDASAMACAAVSLAVAGWVALVMLVSALTTVPGSAGRWARQCAARLAPGVVRAALGLSVVAAPVAASPLAVADSSVTECADAMWSGLDRPASADAVIVPAGDPPSSDDSAGPEVVIVRRGDTLWALARDHLGPRASAADTAAEWPRWFAANRDEIGPDPNLLRLGLALNVPPAQ